MGMVVNDLMEEAQFNRNTTIFHSKRRSDAVLLFGLGRRHDRWTERFRSQHGIEPIIIAACGVVVVNQKQYSDQRLRRFSLEDCHPFSTLYVVNSLTSRDDFLEIDSTAATIINDFSYWRMYVVHCV